MCAITQGMPEQGLFANDPELQMIDYMDIDDRRRFAVLAAVTVDARNQAQQAIDYVLSSKTDTHIRLRDVLRVSNRVSIPWLVDPFLFGDDNTANVDTPTGECWGLRVITSGVMPFIRMPAIPTMYQATTALGLALGSRTYDTTSPQDIVEDCNRQNFEVMNRPMTYDHRWEELWLTSTAEWFARVYSQRLLHAGHRAQPMDAHAIIHTIEQEFDDSVTGNGGRSARLITAITDLDHLALQVLTPYFLDVLIDGGPDDLQDIISGLRTGALHDMGKALLRSINNLTPPHDGWNTPVFDSPEEAS